MDFRGAKSGGRETSWKVAAVTQVRDDGGSDWDGSSGGRKSDEICGAF